MDDSLAGSGRSRAAIVCLSLLFAVEIASHRPRELRGRARALFAFSRMSPEDGRLGGSGFAFARRVGRFVQGVERGTPPTATVSLSYATEEGDGATYASAYFLAPRRLVAPSRLGEADFAAWFRKRSGEWVRGPLANPFPEGSSSSPVPFGELIRVR